MISLVALAKALHPVFCWTHGTLTPPGIPVNNVEPAITGTIQVGNTINCSNGTWANSPTSYAFQWQSEGVNLSGSGNPTTSSYTLQATDIGCLITCVVTATNGVGAGVAMSDLAGPTLGTTVFYVSVMDGLDTNDGTTSTPGAPHGPWKTLTHVNAQSFVAGTSVLFKRGDTWRHDGCPTSSGTQLSPASSGTIGNPIVFDAYGTGENPVLDGSLDLSTTGDWTLTGTANVWQSNHTFNGFGHSNGLPNNVADDPGNLIWGISAVGGTNVPSALVNAHHGVMTGGLATGNPASFIWYKPGDGTANIGTTPGNWNFNTDNNKIQVYCASNPATGLPGVNGDLRAAIDTCLIYFNQQSNIIFQNITLNYCGASPIDTGGAGGACNNIILRDMVTQWYGGGNISGSSGADSRYGDGWDIEGSCSGMLMERIWWHQGYDTGPGPQCNSPHQDNITIRNCVLSNCGGFYSSFFLGGVPTCSGLWIYNNTIYATQNAWSNNPSQRPNGKENCVALFPGNVNYNATTHVVVVQTNMTINNNIFAGIGGINPNPGFGIIGTGWNITGSGINNANPFTSSGAWLNYNCWPTNIQTGKNQQIALSTGNFDISAWVRGINTPGGSGTFTPRLEANGVLNQDPLFVSQSTFNFTLASGSPCLGTGVNLYNSTPIVPPCAAVGLVWDFNHNPRPASGPFSMGAFQESAPGVPVNLGGPPVIS